MIQQKKNKSDAQKKTGSSIASMMAKRDKSKIENRANESYIELIKKPRSKQYVDAVKRMAVACNELSNIEDKLARLEKELSLEGSNLSKEEKELLLKMAFGGEGIFVAELPKDEKDVVPPHGEHEEGKQEIAEVITQTEEVEGPSWLKEEKESDASTQAVEEKSVTPSWLGEEGKPATPSWLVEEKPATPSWLSEETTSSVSAKITGVEKTTASWLAEAPTFKEELARIKEKQKQVAELKAKREAIAEELREAKRQFEASLPAPERMLGLIYPETKKDILLKYGVIAVPGTQFNSPEELLEQVQPQTEQEKQQWLKGNDVYWDFWCEELLLVEIYRDAICVVYDNGDVRTV